MKYQTPTHLTVYMQSPHHKSHPSSHQWDIAKAMVAAWLTESDIFKTLVFISMAITVVMLKNIKIVFTQCKMSTLL